MAEDSAFQKKVIEQDKIKQEILNGKNKFKPKLFKEIADEDDELLKRLAK